MNYLKLQNVQQFETQNKTSKKIIKQKSTQKRNNIKKYPPSKKKYIKHHLHSLNDVYVKQSSIKQAGDGLFATKFIKKNTRLPEPYKGKLLTKQQFKKLKDFRWVFETGQTDGGFYGIDAKHEMKDNPLRFVNGAKTTGQKKRMLIFEFGVFLFFFK